MGNTSHLTMKVQIDENRNNVQTSNDPNTVQIQVPFTKWWIVVGVLVVITIAVEVWA